MITGVRRSLTRNRRGYAALIATIIMVLVVLFLYFNVYILSVNRDTDYQDAVQRANQLDIDKQTESDSISINAYYRALPGGGSSFRVYCDLTNNSPLPFKIVRIWIHGYPYLSSTTPFPILPPNVWQFGETRDALSSIPPITGSYSLVSHMQVTIITSRGNVISKGLVQG